MKKTMQADKEKSKERILKSATKLFAQKGYNGVGIREICKDAKVNICMISYFWGGKEGLYKGIVEDLIEKQTEYAKTFINLEIQPKTLSKDEQINLLYTILDKSVEMLYGGFVSDELIIFLLQANAYAAVSLVDLDTPKGTSYRLGTTDLPEQKTDYDVNAITQPVIKKETQIKDNSYYTYADLSIKNMASEVSKSLDADYNDMQSDLSLLWQGAATNSDIIKFAIYKLSNPDQDKPDKN